MSKQKVIKADLTKGLNADWLREARKEKYKKPQENKKDGIRTHRKR